MTVGMMAEGSSVIGVTREYRPNWSFSMILCRDFDRSEWVRIVKMPLHYTTIRNIMCLMNLHCKVLQRGTIIV